MSASGSVKRPGRVLEHSYNMLLVGNARVGKSSLMRRFAGRFSEFVEHGSRGIEHRNFIIGGDHLVRIVVHDVDPNFCSMLESYYDFSVGIFLIYAIDDRQSFDRLPFWMKHFQEHGLKDSVVTVIGNKKDLEGVRKVRREDAAQFARVHGCSFMEVSAKEGLDVDAAFRITACEIYSKVHEGLISLDRVRT